MKSLLNNLKNLLPYLLLVCIYFFFINIEARKTYNNNTKQNDKRNDKRNDKKLDINKVNLRITIPVIPYNDEK